MNKSFESETPSSLLNSYHFDAINAEVVTMFLHSFCPVIIYRDVATGLFWGEIPVCMVRDSSGHDTIEVVGPSISSEIAANLAKAHLLGEALEVRH